MKRPAFLGGSGRSGPPRPSVVRRIAAALGAFVVVLAGVGLAPAPVRADELRIAVAAEPTALDPQFDNLPANNQIARHVFEPLAAQDENQRLVPALALSWEPLADDLWEFRLRPGVTFHDATPFTADDVKFSLERAAKVPNSPGPFTPFMRQVAAVEIVDPLTVRIRTHGLRPMLPHDLSAVMMLSHVAAGGDAPEGKTTEELNRGEGLVGTGPFRFVEWRRGETVALARNAGWWGGEVAWTRVVFHVLPSGAARVDALLARDVDLIEAPPESQVAALGRDPRVHVVARPSNRLIYLAFDHAGEPSPGVGGTDGVNPFKDVRVRRAFAAAIDRRALVERVLPGLATPAADLLPAPMAGVDATLAAPPADPAAARALMRAAGFERGFSVDLAAPTQRFHNETAVAGELASAWASLGVRAQVEAVAPATFFRIRDQHRYSLYLASATAASGDMLEILRPALATPDPATGAGAVNKGRYSNPQVDARIAEAQTTVDPVRRAALLAEAARVAREDVALVPLHYEPALYAHGPGVAFRGRVDRLILAQDAKPVGR